MITKEPNQRLNTKRNKILFNINVVCKPKWNDVINQTNESIDIVVPSNSCSFWLLTTIVNTTTVNST